MKIVPIQYSYTTNIATALEFISNSRKHKKPAMWTGMHVVIFIRRRDTIKTVMVDAHVAQVRVCWHKKAYEAAVFLLEFFHS